jgi:hypothetical protein
VDRKQTERARALLGTIPEPAREQRLDQIVSLEVQIAAQSNAVPALLSRYASRNEPVPLDALRNGATELRRDGQDRAARQVLEFVYSRHLDMHRFDAAHFLGLAEIRLEENNGAAALELLGRMEMLAGEPFETLPAAAELLERFDKMAEAAEFYERRVKAVPWDTESREKLSELRRSVPDLTTIAGDRNAAYPVRVAAAVALRNAGGAAISTGASDLDLLASTTTLTEAAVNRPYWFRARVEAAAAATDPAVKTRLLLAALATNPEPAEPRIELFRIALAQRRYQLAVSSVATWNPQAANTDLAPERVPEWIVSRFLGGASLGAADRAEVARGLGDAHQRLNDPPAALYYYQLSLALASRQPQQAGVEQNIRAMREAIALRKANEQRRPVVMRNVEQPHIVRPRLTVLAGGGR